MGRWRHRVSFGTAAAHLRASFYYIEYDIAQLGALQVFRNAVRNERDAVANCKHFLTLGGTRPLPELYKAAGVELIFDADRMRELVQFVEERMELLRAGAQSPFAGRS